MLQHNLFRKDPHSQFPAVFYLRSGSIFKSIGFNGTHSFMTKYFTINKLDEKSGCLYLRLMEPYKKNSQLILIPSDTCIVIDQNLLCGSQLLPDIPIKNHVHKPICIQDLFCGHFALLPDYHETVLWKGNINGSFSGSLKICFEEGFEEGFELKVYKQNDQEYKKYPVSKEQQFHFKDCKMIVLSRASDHGIAKGIFEIDITGNYDNEMVSSFLQ